IAFVRASIDKIANQYRRNIWLATLDDGRAVQVRQFTYGPKADTTPRWSPDGRTLAFISVRGERPQIYLIGLDGGEARPLTNRRQGAGEPVWSPDGRRIAFVGRANADERQREDEGREEPPPESALEARHRQEREAEQEQE